MKEKIKVAVTGGSSKIVTEFERIVSGFAEIKRFALALIDPHCANRFLFSHGILQGLRINENENGHDAWKVNFELMAAVIEHILNANPKARICVIGSESGITGSYDMAYAGSKAALHMYIENRRLPFPEQQLVGIAPHIISDAGMTMRRDDQADLAKRALDTPKQRWARAEEVAALVRFLLFDDQGYLTNTVIRMNGGAHARAT